ncbi:6112_t:CDS:1 [Funneliformis geosporum]|uniref:10060_t:CDS:1 n=1 Tax=Funneliformis geosporum TaxID=1117311 RepID=A0A9W4SRE5_9GLOM|nr:6112_t:CDS:1 [Funneliformis geosporum]CAI2178841.1 10060_t:CDS:1 [Funneliformis geosporum]
MGSQENTTNTSEKGRRLAKAHYPSYKRDRLPTLQEVVLRKTAPPVCLFNLYLYMRDVENASEYLDFYLDILEHEILCRAYVKDLKKLGLDVNTEYPEYERYRPGSKMEKDELKFSKPINTESGVRRHLSSSSRGSDNTLTSRGHDPESTIAQKTSTTHVVDIPIDGNNDNKQKQYRDSVRSNKTNTTATTAGNLSFYNRERPFTRDDLRESAERIFFKYIFSGSEKEISLSSHIKEKITRAIEEEGIFQHKRDDPWIYHEAKKEIYTYMEKEYFPRFLKARAFGNMNVTQILMRLGIGIFLLFLGFTIALSLIFLNIMPRTVRLWVCVIYVKWVE